MVTPRPIKEIAIQIVIGRVGGDGGEDMRRAEMISMRYSRDP
jgi:hypothetical protein